LLLDPLPVICVWTSGLAWFWLKKFEKSFQIISNFLGGVFHGFRGCKVQKIRLFLSLELIKFLQKKWPYFSIFATLNSPKHIKFRVKIVATNWFKWPVTNAKSLVLLLGYNWANSENFFFTRWSLLHTTTHKWFLTQGFRKWFFLKLPHIHWMWRLIWKLLTIWYGSCFNVLKLLQQKSCVITQETNLKNSENLR